MGKGELSAAALHLVKVCPDAAAVAGERCLHVGLASKAGATLLTGIVSLQPVYDTVKSIFCNYSVRTLVIFQARWRQGLLKF